MATSVAEQFANDPLAPHSAQFPLGRSTGESTGPAMPSPQGVRPWNLGGMRPAKCQSEPVADLFVYDHHRQIAINEEGEYLSAQAATAKKVTNNDGDEGPSEDFTYDYCPDSPV